MSTKASATLRLLKRSGFPFDPTRPSNWFAGILSCLQAQPHQTDRIDLLASRALLQMEILTRGSRRVFILKQVTKAIEKLCSKNVLNIYTPNRVRIQPGLSQSKLNYYQTIAISSWDEEVKSINDYSTTDDNYEITKINEKNIGHETAAAAAAAADDDVDDDDADADGFELVDQDQIDDEYGDMSVEIPIILPRLNEYQSIKNEINELQEMENTDCRNVKNSAWGIEENAALNALLPTYEATFDARTSSNQSQIGNKGKSPLQPLISAICEQDGAIVVQSHHERTARLISNDLIRIELEWRRTGEIRSFIIFPEPELENVLKHVGHYWINLVIGLNFNGVYGAQRVFQSTTPVNVISKQLLSDLQAIDDAMAQQ